MGKRLIKEETKKQTKKHSYVLLLGVSLVVVIAAWSMGFVVKGEEGLALGFPGSVTEVRAVAERGEEREQAGNGIGAASEKEQGSSIGAESEREQESSIGAVSENESGSVPETENGKENHAGAGTEDGKAAGAEEESGVEESGVEKEEETAEAEDGDGAETEAADQEEDPVMYEADPSYFDDALFIGDSRTVGLCEYGNLGSAEVVADSGMSVYKIFNKKFKTVSGEKKLLETVLSEKQYGKIYLMLGINELGYDFHYTVSKYEDLIQRIRELQPEALIFLEGNLHITGKKSKESADFTNEKIDRFNQAVEQMADDTTMFYLDVNELFDDAEGNLSEEYTTDDVHILAKYYEEWAQWILKHAR